MNMMPKQLKPGCFRLAALAWLASSALSARAATYTLGTTDLLVGPVAGSNSVVLAVTPTNASWTASANAAWLQLSAANQSGSGSTNLVFSFTANTGATRSGTLTIAGLTLTVTQAGSAYVAAGPLTTLVSSNLNEPRGVAVDSAGNVYIGDNGDNAIKKWTPTNNTLTTLVSTNLSGPEGLAVDGAGNVYIADFNDSVIKKWTVASQALTTLVSESQVSDPQFVALDRADNVYYSPPGTEEESTATGILMSEWLAASNNVVALYALSPYSECNVPGGTVDAAGNVYFLNFDILYTVADGNSNQTSTVNLYNEAGIENPWAMAVDGSGNLYISDYNGYYAPYGGNSLWELTAANGSLTQIISGLSAPVAVAVDSSENVYISDDFHNAIYELPNVFVDTAPITENYPAGNGSLPVVLPSTANLSGPFYPTTNASWLTITGVANGVVTFSFPINNTGSARTGDITVYGQTIAVTQNAQPPAATTQSATAITSNSATLRSSINPEGAETAVFFVYGTTTNYGSTNVVSNIGSGNVALSVTNNIAGLSPDTLYHFEAIASNSVGTSLGGDLTFTTAAAAPLATTESATAITSNAATLNASVTPEGAATKVYFVYGTTTNYGFTNVLNDIGNGTSAIPVNSRATGLLPGTLYDFQAIAMNSVGSNLGGNLTFTTAAAPPLAVTDSATAITSNAATLNASVTPEGAETTVYFVYGTTTNYGFTNVVSDIGSGTSALPVSASLNGLAPGSLYHFEAIASNSVGTGLGGDVTFSTGPALGASALVVGSGAESNSVVLAVSGAWTATANDSWLQVPAAFQSGTNSTNVVFTYSAATNDVVRVGTLTIAGLTLTVTQAGTGYVLAGGVNVPLLSSNASTPLNQPSGVAADSAGNVYIADRLDNAIKKWTAASSTLSTLVSSNAATPLNHPYAVAVDGAGNVYIADTGDGAIKEWTVTNDSLITLVSGLIQPEGVALDVSTNVYFTDYSGDSLSEWTVANGVVTTLASGSAYLPNPVGLSVDVSGKVYICVSNGLTVKVWTPGTAVGSVLPVLTSIALNTSPSVAVDGAGNVYIATGNEIEQWTATTGISGDLYSANLVSPVEGVAVDALQNVYVADAAASQSEIARHANAFVDTTPITEGGSAGSDQLPEVLPVTENLYPPFYPATNAAWLSVTGITNGVISFSFTENNTGAARTGDITVLNHSVPITQGAVPPAATTLAATGISATTATLNASVNPEGAATTVYFVYGTTTNYGSTNTVSAGSGTNLVSITNNATGLLANTLYHFEAIASNSVGTSLGGDLTFTTPAGSPLATTQPASNLASTSATLNAWVNPEGAATTVYFAYGTTTNYGSTNVVSNIGSGSVALSVTNNIAGLLPDTLYHFEAIASNSVGTSLGGDLTFISQDGPPMVTTQPAGNITSSAATLNASVNPEGAATGVYFVYGPTTNYGSTTAVSNAGSGNSLLSASNNVTGLVPGTVYYFEAIATNSLGTNLGGEQSFTSLAAPPLVNTQSASNISSSAATLFGMVNPNGAAAGWYFNYGLTTNFGASSMTNLLVSGNSPVAVSNVITNLNPGTAYYFQLAATNSAGTNTGTNLTFITLDIPRTLMIVGFISPGQLQMQFTGGPNVNYTVLTSTNLTLPLTNWTSLGAPTVLSNNVYQFTDPNATNAQQYYMLQ